MNRLQSLFMMFDALGLGAYAVVGVQKSVNQGLLIVPAILVGVVRLVVFPDRMRVVVAVPVEGRSRVGNQWPSGLF